MKTVFNAIFILTVSLPCSAADKVKYIGEFRSARMDVMLGIDYLASPEQKKTFEQSRQLLNITESEIVWNVGKSDEVVMIYSIHGDFLLGEKIIRSVVLGEIKKTKLFHPIYIENENMLWLGGHKFERIRPSAAGKL